MPQTSQQAANALNPTPVTTYTPQNGAFTDDRGAILYLAGDSGLQSLDITSLLSQQEKNGLSNYGDQINAAKAKLKSQYGFDTSSLPIYNIADVFQGYQRKGLGTTNSDGQYIPPSTPSNGINTFLKAPLATTQTNTLNTQASAPPSQTPTIQPPQQPAQNTNQGSIPGQQTPEQAAATEAATGQTPVPQGSTGTVAPPTVALQPGNTGPAVSQLQDYLISQGLMTAEQKATGPGIYGPATTAAVAALQQKLGVDNTSGPGYFGPKTQAAISQSSTGASTNPSGITTNNNSSISASTSNTANPADPYAGMDPVAKQVAMYTQAYNSLGLSDIKTQYEKTMKDEADLQNELADKIADVNNNPWYSEGVRTTEITKLQNKYQTKLDILTNTATLMDSLYKQGQAQVETIVSGAQADIAAANKLAQDQLDATAKLAELNTQVVDAGGRKTLVTYDSKGNVTKTVDLGSSSTGNSNSPVQPGDDPQLYSGLSTQTASAIRGEVSKFKSEPLVTNFGVEQEAKNFVDGLANDTKNPADDQGLLYALAKVLDPNSVVREGEYATAQKYSQSWLQAYGSSVNQAINGTGFLSATARANIKATINARYQASKTSYDAVRNSYANQISTLTGRGDGSAFLNDYTTPTSSNYSSPTTITKDHIMYAVAPNGDLTPIGSAL